ncbi:MAG: CoB--CoM heterodisulfide reductase iron-sulfur subunit B family protein [Candidatus Hodarchaeales archaeon]|jgi:heterodisulfide reductase subunit B
MTKFAYFAGCTIPYRVPFFETALRKTLPEFGIKLQDLPFACCPDPGGAQAFDSVVWHTLGARNITIAEEQNLDIITACSGCFETLKIVNVHLKNDPDLTSKVNENLKEVGREFKGNIKVRHFADVLYSDIGIDKIAARVTHPLNGLKFATHSGCHFLKPPEILQIDNPERPEKFDHLVEALGGTAVNYLNKLACCGAGTRSIDQDKAIAMAHEKIVGAELAGADALVTICPTCFIQLPVFYYAELLALSMGFDLSVGFKMHTIKPVAFLEKFSA